MIARTSNQRVILSGSEVLRESHFSGESSKTCACAGIYKRVLSNLLNVKKYFKSDKRIKVTLLQERYIKFLRRSHLHWKMQVVLLGSLKLPRKTSLPFRMTHYPLRNFCRKCIYNISPINQNLNINFNLFASKTKRELSTSPQHLQYITKIFICKPLILFLG